MRLFHARLWLIVSILIALMPHILLAQDTATPPPESTPSSLNCNAEPEVTSAAEITPEATAPAEATAEVMVEGVQDPDAPLHFNSFLPTDIQFNPDAENPVVVIMIFSLVFENQLPGSIDVTSPKFQLAIDGVPWGDVASTDFQIGQLLGHATQGIVLQSLTFFNNTTDDQKAVFECIKNQRPLDLTLTGTINVAVDGQEQTIQVELTTPQVVIQARKPQS